MIASLKSELRKIYTVRSTYFIILFSLALMLFFAFYTEGMKAGDSSKAVTDPTKLAGLIRDAVTNLAAIGAFVGILSITHEYRYNTIMHTLTASRSRTKTLFAKIVAVSIFAAFYTVFAAAGAVALMYIGLAVKGFSLATQTIPADLWWQVLFIGWGFSMLGLLLAALIRQQVGALAAFFILPGLGEALLGLLLKQNSKYLPFSALQQVTGGPTNGPVEELANRMLSHGDAALVVMVYLVVGWIVAWILFLRRDAN